ncbi:MAG TPA: sulfotransferase [Thermoleophilaceae bacterium]
MKPEGVRAPSIRPDQTGTAAGRLSMPNAFEPLAGPPVFIAGVARSGTTWVLDLFERHPEVCAVMETWLFTQTHGITGVFAQPQWVPEFYELQREKTGLEHATVQLLPYQEMAAELGELAARWLMRAVQPGQRYLVEKGPMDIDAVAAMFPEARFIHVLRDGRDVAVSLDVASKSWAPEVGRASLALRGEHWAVGVEAARASGRALGERYLEVRYEDLRADFDSSARRLFDFAGVPYDDALLAQIRSQTQLDGYGAATRASSFRGKGQAGGWRERFSLRDARAFARATGDLLVELGYASDRRWWWRRA